MNPSIFVRTFIPGLFIGTAFFLAGCSTDSSGDYRLTTSVIPQEGGTVTPSSGTYEQGTRVEIIAVPAEGFFFERWEGDVIGDENPVTIAFYGNRRATAVFSIIPPPAFTEGDGSAGNPYRVSTIGQLQAIDDPKYLDKHFIQVSDIDASPSAEFQHGSGFKHIGDRETPFTGSYNGNGFLIRDLHLHIQRSSDQHTGIFGMIQNARLENITIDNSEQLERLKERVNQQYAKVVDGFHGEPLPPQYLDLSSARGIGGLAGFNDGGTIINCRFVGHVRVAISSGAGGMAGINTGLIENSHFEGYISGGGANGLASVNTGKITHSSFSGIVSGLDSGTGLVSLNYGGEISHSVAQGSIAGNLVAAGFVGRNEGGRIYASYTIGELAGSGEVAGFVHINNGEITDSYSQIMIDAIPVQDLDPFVVSGFVHENKHNGMISTSYMSGEITVPDDIDDVAGFSIDNQGTITASYWDIETTGQSQSVGEGNPEGATGLTTGQMTGPAAETNMPEFDWQTVWRTTDGYPVLRWQGGE